MLRKRCFCLILYSFYVIFSKFYRNFLARCIPNFQSSECISEETFRRILVVKKVLTEKVHKTRTQLWTYTALQKRFLYPIIVIYSTGTTMIGTKKFHCRGGDRYILFIIMVLLKCAIAAESYDHLLTRFSDFVFPTRETCDQ